MYRMAKLSAIHMTHPKESFYGLFLRIEHGKATYHPVKAACTSNGGPPTIGFAFFSRWLTIVFSAAPIIVPVFLFVRYNHGNETGYGNDMNLSLLGWHVS